MTRRLRLHSRALAGLLLLGLLPACGPLVNLQSGPTSSYYTLTPAGTAAKDLKTLPANILVERPEAMGDLDTSRIALSPSPLELRYFAKVRWIDRAPKMMQNLLVTSLENANMFKSVGTETMGLPADYRLKLGLRAMQAEYAEPDGIPTIRVSLSVKLMQKSPLGLVASKIITAEVPARKNKMPEIMKAFDEATSKLLTETVEWTIAAANQSQNPQNQNLK